MSILLSQLVGKTISIQTTSKVYPYPYSEGYYILYGPYKVIHPKPIISFNHIITGKLEYSPEVDKYYLLDKAGNPRWDVSALYERDENLFNFTSYTEFETPNLLEEGNIMPFLYDCLKNGLKHIPKQFKEIRKEIKTWLLQHYHVKPKTDGFVDWYIKTKLTPFLNANSILLAYIHYFASKEMVTTINGEVHFQPDTLPQITPKDIQEYCLYFNQVLAANNHSLLNTLPPAQRLLSPPQSGKSTNVKYQESTFQWQGPVNQNPNQLEELYSLLIDKYIQGSISEFKGVFGHGPFLGPITWKATDSALIWLLLELQEYDFLKKTSRQNWAMLTKLFVSVNKSYSPNCLKAVKGNLKNTLGKKVKSELSALVAELSN